MSGRQASNSADRSRITIVHRIETLPNGTSRAVHRPYQARASTAGSFSDHEPNSMPSRAAAYGANGHAPAAAPRPTSPHIGSSFHCPSPSLSYRSFSPAPPLSHSCRSNSPAPPPYHNWSHHGSPPSSHPHEEEIVVHAMHDIITLWGPHTTLAQVQSSPFYARITIPLNPRHAEQWRRTLPPSHPQHAPAPPSEAATFTLHAVYPIPIRYLRQMSDAQLGYVQEWMDDEYFEVFGWQAVMPEEETERELAARIMETNRRIAVTRMRMRGAHRGVRRVDGMQPSGGMDGMEAPVQGMLQTCIEELMRGVGYRGFLGSGLVGRGRGRGRGRCRGRGVR